MNSNTVTREPLPYPEPVAPYSVAPAAAVVLADGNERSLEGLSPVELHQLQWEQEQRFAELIRACPQGSTERALVTARAYDTICSILAAHWGTGDGPLVMGLDKRYVQLVVKILRRQLDRGVVQPTLFEVGYGCGALLNEVRGHGFDVGGIEISSAMREQALGLLGRDQAHQLWLGDLTQIAAGSVEPRPSLVYWNDVFEHICPDEILDYLRQIRCMLRPDGQLMTITPNWIMRPSDVTGDFCAPRTEARGLHLKEYYLGEVTSLLRQAGFTSVATPIVVTRRRVFLAGSGLRAIKQYLEPWIDRLPLHVADLACRGLGLSCTIATK